MAVLVVASSEARVGRSLIAAAVAYRIARSGAPVTLARLFGDESADADAAAFSRIEYVSSPGRALSADDVKAIDGAVVVEAPAGAVDALATALDARVLNVATPGSRSGETSAAPTAGTIVTNVPARDAAVIARRGGVLAVLPEDRVLAAPSVADIAASLQATWIAGEGAAPSIERVMIGTVASDAAAPYFGERARTCVVTRFDKTDIQLAALQTDLECLVLTDGGQPSPYLIDRVRGHRDEIAVLLAPGSTVETMRTIEGLYAMSRFAGETGKLERAVSLLDAALGDDTLIVA